jgi:hypothetical protein
VTPFTAFAALQCIQCRRLLGSLAASSLVRVDLPAVFELGFGQGQDFSPKPTAFQLSRSLFLFLTSTQTVTSRSGNCWNRRCSASSPPSIELCVHVALHKMSPITVALLRRRKHAVPLHRFHCLSPLATPLATPFSLRCSNCATHVRTGFLQWNETSDRQLSLTLQDDAF